MYIVKTINLTELWTIESKISLKFMQHVCKHESKLVYITRTFKLGMMLLIQYLTFKRLESI